MENQPKLNSSKEVIAFLAERFPLCFTAEGEARPLKIGIFQDLVERVQGEESLSKTQLRSALRLYTSSWRYLYGVKVGAERVDLDGNPCGVLEEQHVEHARKQLEEAKARVQAQRAEQQAKNAKLPLLRVKPLSHVAHVRPVKNRCRVVKLALPRKPVSHVSRIAHSRPVLLAPRQKRTSHALCRSQISRNCKLVKKSKSEQARVRWTQPY